MIENRRVRITITTSGRNPKFSKNSLNQKTIKNGVIVKLKNDCQKLGSGQNVVHNIARDE